MNKMGKPDDIPQKYWDEAISVVGDFDFLLEGKSYFLMVTRIALALMGRSYE